MIIYNEIDHNANAWLQNLINAEDIPQGTIDGRSIKLLEGRDLKGSGNAIVPWLAAEFIKSYMETL